MNIAAMQAMVGQHVQTSSNSVQASQSAGNTFGSVFSSITATSSAVVTPMEQQLGSQSSDESILALFNATSMEELEIVLKDLIGLETEGQFSSITQLGNLEELASMLDLEPEQLMDSILSLLEQAGLSQEELAEVAYSNDFWTMLNAIDKVAPQFFNQLSEALEGKGDLPKQQAVNLLALLKTAELVAPKTDLLLKQEQQVFSLQGHLVAMGEQVEQALQSTSAGKPMMIPLTASRHVAQIAAPTETDGQSTKNTAQEAGQQTILVNNKATSSEETVLKTNSESIATTVTPKESSQQAVSSAVGTVAVAKGEFSITQLENRNNAQSEELVKEMQNIFKRSNFGQTGGTNRLLIKLYPEHLGQVRIELLQVNGVMTARILASTALGKEMLDSQLNQLRQAFLQQNLQVDRIDVSQTLQDTSRNDREQAFNQQFKKQEQESEKQQEQSNEEEMTFQEYMIELEV